MIESYAMKMNKLTKESPKQKAFKKEVDSLLSKIMDDIKSEAETGNYYLSLEDYVMEGDTSLEVTNILRANGFEVGCSRWVGWRDINE